MKKFYTILLVFTGLVLFSNSFAQVDTQVLNAKSYLDRKGEVYFHFQIQSPEILLELTNIISIDNVKNGEVWAYANRKEFPRFLSMNISYNVLPHPGDAPAEMWDASKGIWQFDTYPTYSEYETMMNTFATNFPNICRLDTIATLPSGRRLLAIKITDNPDLDENEPEFFWNGSIHGDETTGYVLFLRLINYLTTNYGTNSKVTNLVNNTEIWICPLSNPDGTYAGGNNTVSGATRSNANGVDMNRNYPDPRAGQHPDGNAWQPETVAWMAFADSHDFVMSGNTHGGAEVYNYPWDTWTSSRMHADDNWWDYLGREYVDTVHVYSPVNYFTDVVANGVTEGGDWYIITGGRQDYMNYFKHCREVTLELSSTKLVSGATLPNYWNYNYRSFLNYMEQSLYGVRGIVTESCTGAPIKALVTINSHDTDSSQVYSSLPIGNYHRPIFAGTYSLTFSAPGYQSQTISNITVSNKATVTQNIQLVPLAPVASFTADHTSGCDPNIQFTNTSQAPSGSTFLWNFGDGQTSTLENPLHSYPGSGNYNVTLTVTNSCSGTDQVVQNNYITLTLPTPPTTTSNQNCGSASLVLNASGTGNLNWYDAPSGGNMVNTGNSYTTPVLTNTTTYYVESSTVQPSQYVGPTNNTSGGGTNTGNGSLIFDCFSPLTIVSVSVNNAGTAGNKLIELKNSGGTVIQSATINVPSGVSRITLNFDVPVGNDYELAGPTNSGLYRLNTGVNFPYNITGLISIKNSSAGTGFYYYFFDWEVLGPGCSSTRVPVTATINPIPNANAGTDQILCSGESSSLTATGGGTYQWSTNETSATININPSSTTTYTVTVTNSQGCSASDAVVATVLPVVNANAGNDQSISTNTSTSLSGSATGGTGSFSYHWEPASLLVDPNVANPTTIALTSTTTFTLTVTDLNEGCTANDIVIVNVSGSTLVVTTTASPQSICPGSTSQLNASATGGTGSYTYQWESVPAGFSSSIANPVVSPTVNTTYTVTVSDGSATNVSSTTINVNPLPTSSFTVNNNGLSLLLNNTSTNTISYMWYFGDGGLSSQANPNYNYATDGVYTIMLIATNSCGSDTSYQVVTVMGIINNITDNLNVTIYPNPTSGILNLNYNFNDNYEISVSDLTGRVVYQSNLDNKKIIDLSKLTEGLYYIKFSTENYTQTIPIVIVR